MWEFKHEEIIDATAEEIFGIIIDLPNYQNWNPFIITAHGQVEIGGVVSGKSVLGKFTAGYRHKIYEYIPNKTVLKFL